MTVWQVKQVMTHSMVVWAMILTITTASLALISLKTREVLTGSFLPKGITRLRDGDHLTGKVMIWFTFRLTVRVVLLLRITFRIPIRV